MGLGSEILVYLQLFGRSDDDKGWDQLICKCPTLVCSCAPASECSNISSSWFSAKTKPPSVLRWDVTVMVKVEVLLITHRGRYFRYSTIPVVLDVFHNFAIFCWILQLRICHIFAPISNTAIVIGESLSIMRAPWRGGGGAVSAPPPQAKILLRTWREDLAPIPPPIDA